MKKIAISALMVAISMTIPSCTLSFGDNKAEYYEEAYEIDDVIDPNADGAYEKYLAEVAKIEDEEAKAQEAAAAEATEAQSREEVANNDEPANNVQEQENEIAMQEKELELRERELALKEREQALNDREKSLSQREQSASASAQNSQKAQPAQSGQKSNSSSQSSKPQNQSQKSNSTQSTKKTETKPAGLSATEIYNLLDKMAYNNKALATLVNDRYENRKAISQISASMNQIIAKLNNCSTMTSDQKNRFKQLTKEFNKLVK